MVRFLTGMLVTVVTFYLALIYKSVALGLLGFCEVALLVSAFLFLLWYRRQFRASISVSAGIVNEEEQVKLLLHAQNKSKFACMKVCWRICERDLFSGKRDRGWYSGAPLYAGENGYQYISQSKNAGLYSFELNKIRIYDITGLFYLNRRCKSSVELYVLPEVHEVSVHISGQTRNFYGDTDSYDDFHSGEDQSEIFDVREFRAGDRIQSIEWKLSARKDELYVREGSLPLTCPVVLFLENSGSKKMREAFLTVAAGISFSLMDAACPHYLVFYSDARQDIFRYRVKDEESFYTFFTIYLSETKGRNTESLEELYRKKYPNDHAPNQLVLRMGPQLIWNGTVIANFEKENLEERLNHLELQL